MIIARLQGGLGNQMFQYAVGRALAVKHGVPLRLNVETYEHTAKRLFKSNFTVRSYDLTVFAVAAEKAERKEIPWIHRMYGQGKFAVLFDAVRRRVLRYTGHEIAVSRFDPKVLELGPNAYLDGFWQSEKYFADIKDTIRKDFTLRSAPSPEITALAEEIVSKRSVCVHVRRGDFVGNAGHEVVGVEYYQRCVEEFAKRGQVEKVYVFSDDIAWCEKNLSFPYPTQFVDKALSGERGEGHMYLMSKCTYFVICNSTFSWWGAWLSEQPGKVVIAPKIWSPDPKVDATDVVPSEWLRM